MLQTPVNTLAFTGSRLALLRKALRTPSSQRAASRTRLLELGALGGPRQRAPQSCCAMSAHSHAHPPHRQPQLPQGRGQTCQSPKIYLMMVAGFSLPTMCREVPGLLGKEQRSHLHADGMVRVASITCFPPVPSEKHSASQGEDLASGSIPEILSCRLYEPQPNQGFFKDGKLVLGDTHSLQCPPV